MSQICWCSGFGCNVVLCAAGIHCLLHYTCRHVELKGIMIHLDGQGVVKKGIRTGSEGRVAAGSRTSARPICDGQYRGL